MAKAGWYIETPRRERWYDGRDWTDLRRDRPADRGPDRGGARVVPWAAAGALLAVLGLLVGQLP